jgi:hypothetical protein
MLSSFLTSKNYKSLSASYLYDDQLDFLNYEVSVEGNLNIFLSPIFLETNDFANNNYSFLHLTKPLNLANITDFKTPEILNKIIFCTVRNNLGNYLYFTDKGDDFITQTIIYDQLINGTVSGINDSYFFDLDVTDSYTANLGHLYNNVQFYLAYNPANYNLNFVVASAFNATTEQTKDFVYAFDENTNVLTLQTIIRGITYYVIYDNTTSRLVLTAASGFRFNRPERFFNIDRFSSPAALEVTNDWGTYETTYNQNNLNINVADSFFGIDNNFLVHTEYNNLEGSTLKTNILTLKNQLNIKNLQGRGNVFFQEIPVNYRNYNTIFSGRRQEQGYEKLHLQYDCYSTPYTFEQSKTTWFHTPQNMYPYKRLNIKTSKLVESGAVAGNHPLKSDKVFKKLGNYRSTSNQGNATSEQTGQWFCSWLSGGNTKDVRPVWVDRYFNPTRNTMFEALSASDGNVTYIPSFDCYNLKSGIVDTPSSLTFEPGCWYAYSRIGKTDAINYIKTLKPTLQQKNLTGYNSSKESPLDPLISENLTTYSLDGQNYGYIDIDNIKLNNNTFTICFWANSQDWSRPMGYEIAGNYNDYGLGIFNHFQVTPFLNYTKNGSILFYNTDIDLIDTFNSALSTFGSAEFVLRRDALNTFHVITDKMQLVEYDIREIIVDATDALSANKNDVSIIYASNDEARGYVLYSDKSLRAVDLVSNLLYPISANIVIGKRSDAKEVVRSLDGKIVIHDGKYSMARGEGVYFLSGGIVCNYNTNTSTLCNVIGSKGAYTFFNIDKYNNLWVGDDEFIAKFNAHQELVFTTSLTATSSFSLKPVDIKNLTFIETFYNGSLNETVLVTASGSDTRNAIIFKLDYDGSILETFKIDTSGNLNLNIEPTNHIFNQSYLRYRYGDGTFTFKTRLYNQFNNEDIEIPSITVNSNDLDAGYHHFAIILNPPQGYMKLYLDGELYDTINFEQAKYNYIPLVVNRLFVGATPFYNGILLSKLLDKEKDFKTSYFVKDLEVENIYIYSTELDYFDIGMHYKEKIYPNNLIFDMPSGRRNFMDVVTRYFKHKVPGAKSTLYNVYINDNILDDTCRSRLGVAIINKLKELTPAYSKLNSLNWVTTLPSQSADYLQPYFPGNTLTNAGQRS